jgi:hypothetical protein
MVIQLPPHYIDLVCDAALKSFWRRGALWTFLRRCGISEQLLATWDAHESKRQFLTRLFRRLESNDAGSRTINTIADALSQQSTFPDLDGWEDSEHKRDLAKAAVSALKEYKRSQQEDADAERARGEVRRRATEIRAEALKRQGSLQKFSDRLSGLSKKLGTQQAGYDFQDWFYDLVEFSEIVGRRPYVVDGRQIDGSITVDGTTYLVELKFTGAQAGAPDVDTFYKKVSSKADNTMGILVSICGFSSVAIDEASGPKTPLLLLDHGHIYMLLAGSIKFDELVCRIRRHSSQSGRAYLAAADFG